MLFIDLILIIIDQYENRFTKTFIKFVNKKSGLEVIYSRRITGTRL